MAKILKRTGADYFINDTGQTVPGNGQLTIDPSDYMLYARSSDVITAISSGDLVYNDGNSDLGIADATAHLQGSSSKSVEVDNITPFASKKIWIGGVLKNLFKRVHGVKSASINASAEGDIDFTIPYPHAKFTGAEMFGTELGDTVKFYVLDTANNDISGLDVGTYGANVPLNQFGFDVEMPPERYANTSDYDADLYQNMVIRCKYTNNGASAKVISMNVWLHEVKA